MTSDQILVAKHNSHYTRGFPWIKSLRGPYLPCRSCPKCRRSTLYPAPGPFEGELEPSKGARWPDILGTGDMVGMMIVSKEVVNVLVDEGIVEADRVHPISIAGRLPKKLVGSQAKEYFWLEGSRMVGAQWDYEGSGYVGVERCDACNSLRFDVHKTYQRQHAPGGCPYAFVEGSWTGRKLFTTDFSPFLFFCTAGLIRAARDHAWTNFRFTRLEEGIAAGSPGIDYLRWKEPMSG